MITPILSSSLYNQTFLKIFTQQSSKPPTVLYLLNPPCMGPCSQMARIDKRDIAKLNEGDIKSEKSIIDLTFDKINTKPTKDLILGTVTGWIVGVSIVRVGKIAAFGLGGGILLLHFASEYGYINVNWERVKEATCHSQACVDHAVKFVKRNTYYSVGLAGGLCFGVAST